MLIGYARASVRDQNLELQRELLNKAGCQEIFEDGASGARSGQPGLAKALETLREGDTLVVWKLDRLGCSIKELIDLITKLCKNGVQFQSLADSIDTGASSGCFFFHFVASLADMEHELNIECPRAGMTEVAKQFGRKRGRKPKMTDGKIELAKRLLASNMPLEDVAKKLDVSLSTLYRWVPPPELVQSQPAPPHAFESDISLLLAPLNKKDEQD